MSNTNMEYQKDELFEKMLEEINMLLISYHMENISAAYFINEVTILKNYYENEIHK